jgi:hypothetical protein
MQDESTSLMSWDKSLSSRISKAHHLKSLVSLSETEMTDSLLVDHQRDSRCVGHLPQKQRPHGLAGLIEQTFDRIKSFGSPKKVESPTAILYSYHLNF